MKFARCCIIRLLYVLSCIIDVPLNTKLQTSRCSVAVLYTKILQLVLYVIICIIIIIIIIHCIGGEKNVECQLLAILATFILFQWFMYITQHGEVTAVWTHLRVSTHLRLQYIKFSMFSSCYL